MNLQRDGIPGHQHAPLKPDVEIHKIVLCQKIKAYKADKNLTYGAIVRRVMEYASKVEKNSEIELWNEAYLRKFVSDPGNLKPSGQQMNLMYRFLDKEGAWDQRAASRSQVSLTKDAVYFALLEFFDVAEKTTTNLLRRLPGIYRVYRPVLTHPDHFVLGVVRIWADDRRGQLYYEEYNAIQRMNGREAKHVTRTGYAFKKSNFVTLFATDTSKSSMHMTTFTSCEIQDDRFIVLFGGFFDTLGKQMYSGRVFMERVQDVGDTEQVFEDLKTHACCIERQNLPPSLLPFFNSPSATGDLALF
jgi:hypothetical protein